MSMQEARLKSLTERMASDLQWIKENQHLLETWHINYHYFCMNNNYGMLTFPSSDPDYPSYEATVAKDCHDIRQLKTHIIYCEELIAEEKIKEEKAKKIQRVTDLENALAKAKLELEEAKNV